MLHRAKVSRDGMAGVGVGGTFSKEVGNAGILGPCRAGHD